MVPAGRMGEAPLPIFRLPDPFFGGMTHIASASLPMRGGMKQGAEVTSMLAKRIAQMINDFTLHDTTTAPTASVEILNGIQKGWGFVPNLHRVLAASPAALEAYSTLWGIAEKTGFTPQERNIVYLAIIYENECTYCMAGHTNLSRMAKVDNAAIAAVREGRPIADARLEALRQFATVSLSRMLVPDSPYLPTIRVITYLLNPSSASDASCFFINSLGSFLNL